MNTYAIMIRVQRKNKQGLCPLFILSTEKGKQIHKSIGLHVNPIEWNVEKAELLTTKHNTNNNIVNIRLAAIKAKANDIKMRQLLDNTTLPAKEFVNAILGIANVPVVKIDQEKLVPFFEKFILTKKDVEYNRIKHYEVFIKSVKKYSPNIKMDNIDYTYCTDFFNYLRATTKNSNNTLIQKLKILRLALNEAVRRGVIEKNNTMQFKIKAEPTHREALSIDEVNVLQDLHNKGTLKTYLHDTLTRFLFCCYTGLRYSEMHKFTDSNIKGEMIEIKQDKTKNYSRIPYIKQAKKMYELMPEGKITNQKMNCFLKEIKAIANIQTSMSCHIARHTFATIGLNTNVSLISINKALGHTKLATTQIYAKLLDTTQQREFENWGK